MRAELGGTVPGDLRTLIEAGPEVLGSLHVADWTADPWARGAVSVAPVGAYFQHTDLAAPTTPCSGRAKHVRPTATPKRSTSLREGRRAAIEALHLLRPLTAR
ncbi:hypothetical protein [Amycolatopsis jejuensis]|uniref:hypothetical protein n=1 Tax=Amycolatopsis jejuensis TaxID=330084 RepID=UPI000A7AA03F|nr:hypothetical protein [Amycolatopsis jejuensis]